MGHWSGGLTRTFASAANPQFFTLSVCHWHVTWSNPCDSLVGLVTRVDSEIARGRLLRSAGVRDVTWTSGGHVTCTSPEQDGPKQSESGPLCPGIQTLQLGCSSLVKVGHCRGSIWSSLVSAHYDPVSRTRDRPLPATEKSRHGAAGATAIMMDAGALARFKHADRLPSRSRLSGGLP